MYGKREAIEDRAINRGCQEACQRITEALNHIVGWQLESTTWLKRTLVVKQDSKSSHLIKFTLFISDQKLPDISPTMDYRPIQNSLGSEVNSIKGSRSSLVTETNRLSAQDANHISGSVAQLSTITTDSKKSAASSTIRSSAKDPNNNRKDPAYSTQALFLLADVSSTWF
jgi:hypothetical protein